MCGRHMKLRYLTIGFRPDPDHPTGADLKSLFVVVPNTPEDIGELIVWLENWYCRGEA